MTEDDDDSVDTTFAKVVDTAFDDGFVSERKKGFECAHAARVPCREENG
jgi:hypothetical protein